MRPRQSRTPPSATLRLPARGRLHPQCKCLLFLGSHLTLKCVSVPQCGPHYKYDSSGCYGWGRPRQSLQMFWGLFKNCGSEQQLRVWLKVLPRVCRYQPTSSGSFRQFIPSSDLGEIHLYGGLMLSVRRTSGWFCLVSLPSENLVSMFSFDWIWNLYFKHLNSELKAKPNKQNIIHDK